MGTREWVMEPAGRIVPLAGSVAAPSTLLPPAPSRPWAGGEGPVEKSALDARPRTTCGPVTEGERLSLLDALRGFALAGVLLANLNSLTLYEFLSPEQRAALPTAGFDHWARMALVFFVSKKFLTLFSLLFGVGFAVQLMRAEARGGELVPTYARRLVVLLVIGLAHGTLLYWGDILRFYAVLGFVLLLFRRASSRALLWTGVALACVGWPLLRAVADPFVGPLLQRLPSRRTASAETFAIFSDSRYVEVVWRNPVQDLTDVAQFWYLPLFVLGTFLLGFWAGRQRVFHDPHRHRALLRRIFAGSLLVGVAGNAVGFLDLPAHVPVLGTSIALAASTSGPVALGVAYATAFALLFLRPAWRRRLEVLAPVGRMALTNYLGQAVVCVPVFYGFGLGVGPQLGIPGRLATFALLFGAQIVFSHWWLTRFRFGPAEWVWRSLTYLRLQPMRPGAALRVAESS